MLCGLGIFLSITLSYATGVLGERKAEWFWCQSAAMC
jgi:hypothetical protein